MIGNTAPVYDPGKVLNVSESRRGDNDTANFIKKRGGCVEKKRILTESHKLLRQLGTTVMSYIKAFLACSNRAVSGVEHVMNASRINVG